MLMPTHVIHTNCASLRLAMAARAVALHLDNLAALGRYRISGLSTGYGAGGIIATMAGADWTIDEVLFMADNHAIVLAATAPRTNRIRIRH